MNSRTYAVLGVIGVAAAVVAGVIMSLQSFDAGKISCENIGDARESLESLYVTGVNASVQVYAEEKAAIDERLSQCLHAKPVDPCADAQAARDAAVAAYNGIASPPDSAPHEEFQTYFAKREAAYQQYKTLRDALQQCRAANPPKPDVPYEMSDTKACFDAYDSAVEGARDTFERDTQTMRSALKAALAALDAREKACNPPTREEKFTDPPRGGGGASDDTVSENLMSCRLLSAELDTELFILRKRAAAIPTEIQAIEASIENIRKRMNPLDRDLRDVNTYIPPESTRTQFEGALNALRAERKVAIEAALAFYQKLLEKRQGEKSALENELSDLEAQIAARLAEIQAENETRQRNFPTSLHQSKPDKCAYYHCHGMLCGKPDPQQDGCGHGATTEADTNCKLFFDAYLNAAGVN
jgi:hypothetical protein